MIKKIRPSYPHRYKDMVILFGQNPTELRLKFNKTLDFN